MRLGDLDALKAEFDLIASKSATSDLQSIPIKHIKQIIDNATTAPLPDFKEGYKQAILDGQTNFKRPQGEWIVVKQDHEGIHKIECPFCKYSKGSDFSSFIGGDFSSILTVIFEKFPPFCENCGADMRGEKNENSN